jgi:hypothetical protein
VEHGVRGREVTGGGWLVENHGVLKWFRDGLVMR